MAIPADGCPKRLNTSPWLLKGVSASPRNPKIDPRRIGHNCQISRSPASEIMCLWISPPSNRISNTSAMAPGRGPMEGGFCLQSLGPVGKHRASAVRSTTSAWPFLCRHMQGASLGSRSAQRTRRPHFVSAPPIQSHVRYLQLDEGLSSHLGL